MSRFFRFLGPGNYRVEVATPGDKPIEEHMMPAPELGAGFMRIADDNGLSVYVNTDSFDRVVEIPWIAKEDRHAKPTKH